jgi:hypothetical protein
MRYKFYTNFQFMATTDKHTHPELILDRCNNFYTQYNTAPPLIKKEKDGK